MCVIEGKKNTFFVKFIEAVFYEERRCVGLDGRASKGAMCRKGRQRLFKACQPGRILSHSYLVCLDGDGTKGKGSEGWQQHNWHVD